MSASLTTSAATSNTPAGSSLLGGNRSASIAAGNALSHNLSTSAALFREIHKNTWLKRLTADGKKITVGPKKSERSWVVFCVHDDSQALLEGYAEPRQAASHNPEWVVSMQETQHISHALIPNSHEFEFVVTLSNEVIRFHAMSWEIMQEWVETLRSKLREMKILSPRENLYTKLPEIRAPLLPTRDPTSPLPAPPPVPAAMVPGVERVIPHSVLQSADSINTSTTVTSANEIISTVAAPLTTISASFVNTIPTSSPPSTSSHSVPHIPNSPHTLTSMSNTLTQNLLNMLSDPITAYSEQLHEDEEAHSADLSDLNFILDSGISYSDSNEELFLNPTKNETTLKENVTDPVSSDQATDIVTENSVRVDIENTEHESHDQNTSLDYLIQSERLIPRPQTYRSLSIGAADKSCKHLLYSSNQNVSGNSTTASNCNNNITELEISSEQENPPVVTTTATDPTTNITIIQVTNINENLDSKHFNNNRTSLGKEGDIFKFPEGHEATKSHDEYKSNVQIIPSNLNSSTIQVMGQNVTAVANQYSTPIKKNFPQTTAADVASTSSATSAISSPRSHLENHIITTVHVNEVTTSTPSIYGTCYTETPTNVGVETLQKKIILTANSSGVTNITVNNVENTPTIDLVPKSSATNSDVKHNVGNVRYEKVFLSSSIPIAIKDQTEAACKSKPPLSRGSKTPKRTSQRSEVHRQSEVTSIKFERLNLGASSSSSLPSSPTLVAACSSTAISKHKPSTSLQVTQPSITKNSAQLTKKPSVITDGSPLLQRKHVVSVSPINTDATTPLVPTRQRFLTRGLTEAVITARPSRKDFCLTKVAMKPNPESNSNPSSNNNGEATTAAGNTEICPHTHSAINRTRSESLEQRRRSSSTSEAQTHRTRVANNNELPLSRGGSSIMRMQQPPHPFRSVENGPQCSGVSSPSAVSPAPKRMTLREQQVMQLRREIMHPGGVRLQLRRKDCVGSIAWVDAFGAIWVAGWKQKEHPVLYNALHIGDQLISVAGVAVSTAAETNKVIRNTNTLFVEVLIRRIPFGRGYAIRREREGQCLGLIRDGNTSTIVDVVPNSLAARHGLPPKAQSCDGSTLTFWVLTEINGRPLNLFFKENEIRDRLNSVGRDISILVQPSDLITKLKKQLKSLRGYKDYLVQ